MNTLNMRFDAGMNRTEFAKHWNIPRRTVENWEYENTAPDYVIDLLGRAVYTELFKRVPEFVVVASTSTEEFEQLRTHSYTEAIAGAERAWDYLTEAEKRRQRVTIRVYDEEGDDYDLVKWQ